MPDKVTCKTLKSYDFDYTGVNILPFDFSVQNSMIILLFVILFISVSHMILRGNPQG